MDPVGLKSPTRARKSLFLRIDIGLKSIRWFYHEMNWNISIFQVEKDRYFLVNLNSDPSMNELLVYYLNPVRFWNNRYILFYINIVFLLENQLSTMFVTVLMVLMILYSFILGYSFVTFSLISTSFIYNLLFSHSLFFLSLFFLSLSLSLSYQ